MHDMDQFLHPKSSPACSFTGSNGSSMDVLLSAQFDAASLDEVARHVTTTLPSTSSGPTKGILRQRQSSQLPCSSSRVTVNPGLNPESGLKRCSTAGPSVIGNVRSSSNPISKRDGFTSAGRGRPNLSTNRRPLANSGAKLDKHRGSDSHFLKSENSVAKQNAGLVPVQEELSQLRTDFNLQRDLIQSLMDQITTLTVALKNGDRQQSADYELVNGEDSDFSVSSSTRTFGTQTVQNPSSLPSPDAGRSSSASKADVCTMTDVAKKRNVGIQLRSPCISCNVMIGERINPPLPVVDPAAPCSGQAVVAVEGSKEENDNIANKEIRSDMPNEPANQQAVLDSGTMSMLVNKLALKYLSSDEVAKLVTGQLKQPLVQIPDHLNNPGDEVKIVAAVKTKNMGNTALELPIVRNSHHTKRSPEENRPEVSHPGYPRPRNDRGCPCRDGCCRQFDREPHHFVECRPKSRQFYDGSNPATTRLVTTETAVCSMTYSQVSMFDSTEDRLRAGTTAAVACGCCCKQEVACSNPRESKNTTYGHRNHLHNDRRDRRGMQKRVTGCCNERHFSGPPRPNPLPRSDTTLRTSKVNFSDSVVWSKVFETVEDLSSGKRDHAGYTDHYAPRTAETMINLSDDHASVRPASDDYSFSSDDERSNEKFEFANARDPVQQSNQDGSFCSWTSDVSDERWDQRRSAENENIVEFFSSDDDDDYVEHGSGGNRENLEPRRKETVRPGGDRRKSRDVGVETNRRLSSGNTGLNVAHSSPRNDAANNVYLRGSENMKNDGIFDSHRKRRQYLR